MQHNPGVTVYHFTGLKRLRHTEHISEIPTHYFHSSVKTDVSNDHLSHSHSWTHTQMCNNCLSVHGKPGQARDMLVTTRAVFCMYKCILRQNTRKILSHPRVQNIYSYEASNVYRDTNKNLLLA